MSNIWDKKALLEKDAEAAGEMLSASVLDSDVRFVIAFTTGIFHFVLSILNL